MADFADPDTAQHADYEEKMVASYVGINSIRHPDELFRHLGTTFSISNFNRSVLLCIEADFCDQICVGKPWTRSTCVLLCVVKSFGHVEIYKFLILLAS